MMMFVLLCVCFAMFSSGYSDGGGGGVLRWTTEPVQRLDFAHSRGAQVECEVGGVGAGEARVEWRREDGTGLSSVSGLTQVKGHRLLFHPFPAHNYRMDVHSATYHCTATLDAVGTIRSTDVHVNAVVMQQHDIQVYDAYVMERNTAVLRCHIPPTVRQYYKVVDWILNENTLISQQIQTNSNEKYEIMPNGDLHVFNTTMRDSGSKYKCKSVNSLIGESQISFGSGQLYVTESRGSVPAKMMDTAINLEVEAGGVCVIPCVAQGNPVPSVKWFKKNMNNQLAPLSTDSRFKQTKSSLKIESAQVTDEGVYVCKVQTAIANIQMTANVTVFEKLSVKVFPLSQNAKTNSRVSFTCETTGHPVSNIEWVHNGLTIRNANEKTMTIESVQLSNKGFYQCIAKNHREMVESIVELQLAEISPQLTETFKEVMIKPKATVTLKCVATGTPIPSIEWAVDRTLLTANLKININVKKEENKIESILNINNVINEDGGLYSCSAINKGGKSEHSARINVYGKLGMRVSPEVIAVSDSTFYLNCPFYGYPITSITWEKDEQRLPHNFRQGVFDNGTFLTSDADKFSDAGEYKCHVKADGNQYVEAKVDVRVLVPPKLVPFEFQEELLREGMRARLQCVVSEGDLPLNVNWLKDGNVIPSYLGILMRTLDEYSSILTINSITPKHNGEYTCLASNEAATVTHSAQLSVNVPPKVIPFSFLDDQFYKGMRAHVTCAISQGDTPLTFEWLKDGQPISKNLPRIFTRKYDENTDSLSIENVESIHSGGYTCIVRNMAGSATHTAQLMVRVSPKIVPFQFGNLHSEGSPARVVCGLQEGDAPVHFSWLHNGFPVQETDTILIHEIDGLSSILTISKLFATVHKGNYTCVAENRAGADRYEAVFHINAPKIVPFAFQGDHVFEGAIARLTCVVYQGDLPLNIVWTKDHNSIPFNLGVNVRSVDTYTSILTIDRVERKHQGEYSCVAENKAASASHTATLIVNVPPKIVPFDFDRENNIIEGQLARVSCIISRGDLPLVIYWEKDGVEITEQRGIQIKSFDEHSSILSIASVLSNLHNGEYTCVAKNAAGIDKHSADILVKVPPRWIKIPKSISALKNSFLIIDCEVDGFPKPEIVWKKSANSDKPWLATPIKSTNNLHIFSNGTLIINKFAPEHEGSYYCIASNGIGKGLSTKIEIKLNAPPSFTMSTQKVNAVFDTDVELHCSVHGNTPIKMSWFRDEKIIQDGQKSYKIKSSNTEFDAVSNLTILKANREDNGNYTCKAENIFGFNQTLILLAVLESPDAPSHLKATIIGSRNVEIIWSSPFNGNQPIDKYLIQYKEVSSNWDKAALMETVNGIPTNSIINQLTPFTTYMFRVFAENSIGRSSASQILRVTTEEDLPTGLPTEIHVESINTETFKITWKAPNISEWNGHILGYHIGYKEVDTEDPYIIKTLTTIEPSSDNMFVHIGGLKQFTKYAVIVQCYNSKGKGPATEPVIMMTSEGAPTISPNDVHCTTLTSQSVHVTWSAISPDAINGILRGYKILYRQASDWLNEFADSFNVTLATSITLQLLDKFSNYSIQVVAMTRAGSGPRSQPVFCKTLDDVPSEPSSIKVVPSSENSVVVAWKKPENPNGIIKGYTVHWRNLNSNNKNIEKHQVISTLENYEVTGLQKNQNYEFWISASTIAGEGAATKPVSQKTMGPLIPAKMVSFDNKISTTWKSDVSLPCVVIANPTAVRKWTFRNKMIGGSDRVHVTEDGSLTIKEIEEHDAGDYICNVHNDLGQDKITYTIIVLGPPSAPTVEITSITANSLEVQWKIQSSKTSRIKCFGLHLRKDGGEWDDTNLNGDLNQYKVSNLDCGTRYEMYLTAQNRLGLEASSITQLFSTNGSVPTSPMEFELMETSSNSVSLYLNSWKSNECPIQYFVVEYAELSANNWIMVSNYLKPEQRRLVIPNLQPATWYSLRMTAQNSAGSTIAKYDFATLTNTGATIAPNLQADAPRDKMDSLMATLNFYVIIPISCTVVILFAIFAFACLWLKLKKRDINALHANRMSVVGSEIRRGDSSESFAYMQRELANRQAMEAKYGPEDIAPYATLQLPGNHFPTTLRRHGNFIVGDAGTMVNHQFIIPQGIIGFVPGPDGQMETTFVFPPPPPPETMNPPQEQQNPASYQNDAINFD